MLRKTLKIVHFFEVEKTLISLGKHWKNPFFFLRSFSFWGLFFLFFGSFFSFCRKRPFLPAIWGRKTSKIAKRKERTKEKKKKSPKKKYIQRKKGFFLTHYLQVFLTHEKVGFPNVLQRFCTSKWWVILGPKKVHFVAIFVKKFVKENSQKDYKFFFGEKKKFLKLFVDDFEKFVGPKIIKK